MKITEKELLSIQELCCFEELQYNHYKNLLTFTPSDDLELKNLFEYQAKRHKNNIARLLQYLN